MSQSKEFFINRFPQYSEYADKLDKLAHLVEDKSKFINITAIRDYESIWEKHIIDSLIPLNMPEVVENLGGHSKVLDFGTGGGFPGLPLAIANPNANFTLLDSTRKKLDVVNEFAAELSVTNIKTIWGRGEEISGKAEYKNSFDVVTARAVAFLPELLVLTHPFVKNGGYIVLYKIYDQAEVDSGNIQAEQLKLKLLSQHKYSLGGSDRVILVYNSY